VADELRDGWLAKLGDGIEDKRGETCEIKAGTFDPKTREFDAIASTSRVDRDTEVVLPSAFAEHLDEFKANPVMLFSHNPFTPPIGSWPKIAIQKTKIPVTGRLRPEGDDDLTDNIANAIGGGFLRTVSIGFRVFERQAAEFDDEGNLKKPTTITKAALYEISVVNVPANVDAAIRMAKTLASDVFEREVVKTIFAPAPTDGQVVRRATAILGRYVERTGEGEDVEADLVAAVKELREHVVALARDRVTDFDRLRAVRELTDELKSRRRVAAAGSER